MTRQEAQYHFDNVVCDLGYTVKDLKDDLRLAHILVHGRGLFPDEVEDDDAFFNQVLDILDSTDEAKLKKTVIEEPLQSTDKQCNLSISLSNEEWNWVKQNAELQGETIEEYLQRYLEISIATSFRESLIHNA